MTFWQDYIGVPYKDCGRSREGCDCYGLVWLVWKEQKGILLPSYDNNYLHVDNPDDLQMTLDAHISEWDQVEQPEPFSLALFNYYNGQLHCGLMVSAHQMLHIARKHEARVEKLKDINNLQGYYLPHGYRCC